MAQHKNAPIIVKSKVIHTRQIMEYLRLNQHATIVELSQATGIPIASIYRVIQMLMEKNVVVLSEKLDSYGGRKAGVYAINGDFCYILGIYMAKQFVEVFVADMNADILCKQRESYGANATQAQVMEMIDRNIRSILEAIFGDDDAKKHIAYIGLTAEAAMDSKNGCILSFAGLECMNNFWITAYMERIYGVHTCLLKAVNLNVGIYQDEMSQAGIKDYIYLNLGAGIGVGIVLDGKLYEGAHGNAGELLVEEWGDSADPMRIYSARMLYDEMYAYLDKPENAQLRASLEAACHMSENDRYGAKCMQMLDLAVSKHDTTLRALADKAVGRWGKIVRALVAFYDPQMIILGGDISDLTPNMFALLRERLLRGWLTDMQVQPADSAYTKQHATIVRLLDYVCEDLYLSLTCG